MLYPLGLSHSNRKMDPAAAWTATITTNIQEEKSNGSRKAVGEMMPVRLATRMVIPVSRKGTEKSITLSRAELIFSDVITRSVYTTQGQH